MQILSLNINGLRAFINNERALAIEKYFDTDVICFQETKCDPTTVKNLCNTYFPHKTFSNSSKFKNGYAGVTTLVAPELLGRLINCYSPDIMDDYGSGRVVVSIFDTFTLVNVYTLNSGGKQDYRIDWDERFNSFISTLLRPVIIVGDLNVVGSNLDYWGDYNRAIDTMPGLYKFELDGFEKLKRDQDLVDTFRFRNPETRAYSWYSYRGNARNQNQGWRIDYTLISKSIIDKVNSVKVLSNTNASDHCPVLIDINL